jgi:hypothetical protein
VRKILENIEVIPEEPSGRDVQEYITWILTQDAIKNPVNDFTGERAARNQGRYHVWFIPGTTTHKDKITRTCAVPSNTEIVILAATSDSSYLEHKDAKNDGQLLEIAKVVAELHKDVEIKIRDDEGNEKRFGVKDAKNPQEHELKLIERDAFPINIPENNIYRQLYGVRGGYTHLAVVALGIKVKLKPGKYTLTMKAHHDGTSQPLEVDNVKVDAPPFNLDIEYELTALEEKEPLSSFTVYPD